MNRLLAAAAVVLSIATQASAASELPVTLSPVHCDLPLQVHADSTSLSFRGTPRHRHRLWIEENGLDIELPDPHDPTRMRDSGPARHAMEPLVVELDTNGYAQQTISVVSRERAGSLVVHCDPREDNATLDAFVRLRARLRQTGNPLDGLASTFVAQLLLRSDAGELKEWTYFQLASIARSGAMLHEAAAWAQLAENAASDNGNPRRVVLALFSQGQSLFGVGDRAAEERFESAARAAAVASMPYARAIAQHDLCLVRRVAGDVSGAATCLAQSADRFAALGEARDRSNALRNRATALLMLGRYEDARRTLAEAAEQADQLGNARQQAMIAHMQAQLATWAGDFEAALSLLGAARAQLVRENFQVEAIHTQRLIADTYALAGEPKRALVHYQQALLAYEDRRMFSRSAPIKATMARWLEEEERLDEALDLLEAARAELEGVGSASAIASASLGLARLQLARGRLPEASDALDDAERQHALSGRWRGEANLIRARLVGPQFASADELNSSMVAAARGGHVLLYLDLAKAAVEQRQALGKQDEADRIARSALQQGFHASRRVRSPGVRHALLRRLVPFAVMPIMSLPEGAVDAAEVWGALAGIERLREVEQQAVTGIVAEDLLTELERTLASDALNSEGSSSSREREELLLELVRVDSTAHDFTGPQREKLRRDAPPSLPPGHVLLYILGDDRATRALRLDSRGWLVVDGLDEREIRQHTDRARVMLASGHADRSNMQEAIGLLAKALRWSLLMDQTPSRLYVVADRALAGLPWSMLPAPDSNGTAIGLAAELVMLQALGASSEFAPRTLHTLGASAGDDRGLVYLAAAEDELQRVNGHWRHLSTVSSPHAHRDALMQALATPGALVHIAAHGRADQGLAEDSGLWLRDVDGKPQFVSALRLRQSPVAATMVVLSACESGYTEADRSFGVGGVGGSLVDAGADAVVATRWPVSDRAALAFSDAFHGTLAERPDNPSLALRHAVATVQRVPGLRHPTHWAGWFLLQSGPEWAFQHEVDRATNRTNSGP